jgi:hypothetical protein
MLSRNKVPQHRTLIHKRSSHHSSSTSEHSPSVSGVEPSLIPVFYTKGGGKQQQLNHKLHSSKKGVSWKRQIIHCVALGMVISCIIWTFLISSSLINNGRYELYSTSRNTTGKKRPMSKDDDMIVTRIMGATAVTTDAWMLQQRPHDDAKVLTIQQRQERCRPLPAFDPMNLDVAPSLPLASNAAWPTRTIEVSAVLYDRTHWQDFCKESNVNKKSRIVVTNALSMPVATAFTLFIAKQCDVRSILIVDAMAPNIKAQRILYMNAYRTILSSIHTVKLVVPTHSAGLGKLDKDEDKAPLHWLESFRPSHILHFEPEQAYREMSSLWEEYMPPSSQLLYHLHHSELSMQQILSYCQARRESVTDVDPLFVLHVATASSPSTADVADSEHALLYEKNQEIYASVRAQIISVWAVLWYRAQSRKIANHRIHLHQVRLPSVHGGPWIMAHDSNLESSLYMEDAMVALLQALQPQKASSDVERGLSQIIVQKRVDDDHQRSLAAHEYRNNFLEALQWEQRYPYGMPDWERNGTSSEIALRKDGDAVPSAWSILQDTYGIHTTRFPCASSCYDASTSRCDPSIWDAVFPFSRSVTESCTYVIYFVNVDTELDQLFEKKPIGAADGRGESSKVKVCRVAFVAKQSPLVQEALKHMQVEGGDSEVYNGKLKLEDWTLVWLSTKPASKQLRIDDSILRIDPSRFFAPTVRKVMYTESDAFAQSADLVLVHIFSNIDRPARGTHFTKEFRVGLEHVHRMVEQEPALARSVSFFTSELSAQDDVKTVADYVKRVEKELSDSPGPRRHFSYYKQLNHWLQSDTHRPLLDGAGPQAYRTAFPWQWISTKLMVHNLQSEAARQLRCNWFDAHLYWGPDHIVPGTEDLSFAYVVGRQRLEGNIGPGLEEDPTWIPQIDPVTQEHLLENQKNEAFIRIMKGDGK